MWFQIEPLLRSRSALCQRGRPRLSDRAALTGILFVLSSGVRWEQLPREMGCGSGMTCSRRLREWQDAGVWDEIRKVVEKHSLNGPRFDWARADNRRHHVIVELGKLKSLMAGISKTSD